MSIKIAVFGLESSIDRIKKYAHKRSDIEIIPFIYEHAKNSKDLVLKAMGSNVFLFTGPLPFLYAQEELKQVNIPAVYVQFDEFMVSTSFFRLKNELNQNIQRLSIDIMNEYHINEVLNELEIIDRNIYTYGYGKDQHFDIESIVDFHTQLWEEGKIDYVLTTIGEVEKSIREKGIPCSRMKIPSRNLERAIEEAKVNGQLKISQSSQIVVGFLKIKNFDSIVEEKGDFFGQELLLRLHQLLLNFGHNVFASIINNGSNHFYIFGTRGILDYVTNQFQDFPLIREIENELNVSINIGFGLGLTANQAEQHAKLALMQGKHSASSSCYIVNEHRKVIGPLGDRSKLVHSKLFKELTENVEFSNEAAARFIEFNQIRENAAFSAEVLADYYSVTKRSAERMIQKLLNHQMIKVAGEEKPYQQGRPRKLYQLILGDE
ncbi:hypothetical protein V7149_16570 [Bacillus sp. JJ1503]|uniref:hypothetical protein n=1 Tax=unclassified Bacillus (in: firmicutes) TaxID=185979 RepID=UPI002FFEB950